VFGLVDKVKNGDWFSSMIVIFQTSERSNQGCQETDHEPKSASPASGAHGFHLPFTASHSFFVAIVVEFCKLLFSCFCIFKSRDYIAQFVGELGLKWGSWSLRGFMHFF